jgi:hypothetical protein
LTVDPFHSPRRRFIPDFKKKISGTFSRERGNKPRSTQVSWSDGVKPPKTLETIMRKKTLAAAAALILALGATGANATTSETEAQHNASHRHYSASHRPRSPDARATKVDATFSARYTDTGLREHDPAFSSQQDKFDNGRFFGD